MALNRFSGQGVQNTLEQYIPLPFQEMMQAGQAYQQRGDAVEQKQQEVELGLSSMEALAGEHQKFRDSFVNDYRKKSTEILKN